MGKIRLPLVYGDDGLPQQLQAGDSIQVPMNTPTLRPVVNGNSAATMAFGTAVYATGNDTVKPAQANAKATSRVSGLVYDPSIASGSTGYIATGGTLVGTTAQWDAVTSQTGGLTFDGYYFLDPANPGKITSTPPVTVGQCNTLVGHAISTTELELILLPPSLL